VSVRKRRAQKIMRRLNVYRYLRKQGIHNEFCKSLDPDVGCVCPWGGPR
jgi:hypothetical protein